jgi:hypothetical protein
MAPSLAQISRNRRRFESVFVIVVSAPARRRTSAEAFMHRTPPVLVLLLLVTGCGSSSSGPSADRTPAPSSSASASTSATAPATATPTPATVARAVYYLHDDGHGPRLYREFHRRPVTPAVIRDAVTAMLTDPPVDSDYTSLWPRSTTVRGVRVSGTTAYVDLSRDVIHASSGSEGEAQSLQQLVYTVTAAAPALRSVQLLIDGHPVETLWGHVDTRKPISRAAPAEVLGPVWLEVTRTLKVGSRFGGQASVFEATVTWEFRQGSRVVRVGHTNASIGAPGRGPWSAIADVPPGDYVLRAFEVSAKDGSATFIDDKPVTVTR